MGSSLFSTPSKKLKKMKCVAILLAIVVAVAAKDETAATSACPEIDQAKYVYVAEPRVNSCVYSNRLDVPKEWFTAKFYLDDGHIENVPTPKKVSYKLVGVAPFKATWKGACQPEKKDCKAQTVDDYKTKDDLATVEETYNKRFKDDEDSLTNKHLEWNAAIADWQKGRWVRMVNPVNSKSTSTKLRSTTAKERRSRAGRRRPWKAPRPGLASTPSV